MSTSSCCVAVFGETLVDQFETGPVVGGAPFNVARHLAAFGHAPLMLSAVGRDAAAELVMAEFARYGMATTGMQATANQPTGVVDVQMAADGSHQFRIRTNCAWDVVETGPALAAAASLASDGWLYSGTLALRSPVSRATGMALMRDHLGPKYVDLNWREGHVTCEVALEAIALADVLKVNEEELTMLCAWMGSRVALGSVEAAASFVLDHLTLRTLLVTCGAAGSVAFGADGARKATAPARQGVRLVDTVGAGDSFSAVMLVGLLRGWNLQLALERANRFAARICEVRGAVPTDLAFYEAWGFE
ncbi:MAG TPA: PfkB family carbohydrate kinase [Burkholderiaceae bacterium]|nr:PfkB family carbohydrate kinase [Burkholderiaceae bacterium]